ncbi:MAG: SHOCT domain-containing protein [Desulfitobacteriaceae bacterium]
MSKEQAIIHYRTAMTVFRKWLAEGIITEEELSKIDTIIAQKYGLSSCSIYRLTLDITGV